VTRASMRSGGTRHDQHCSHAHQASHTSTTRRVGRPQVSRTGRRWQPSSCWFPLIGVAFSMLWGGREVLSEQGLGFFFSTEWNPVENRVRRAGADLRNTGHFGDRLDHRGAGEFRHRGVPDRSSARLAAHSRRLGAIELLAGIPSIIYGMWGLFVLAPDDDRVRHFPGSTRSSGPGRSSARCSSGPPLGIGMLTAGWCSRSWSFRSSPR
jgi:hypothetical protein